MTMSCKNFVNSQNICNTCKLVKCMIIKFGVFEASNNKVIHFKTVLPLGLQIRLVVPLPNSKARPCLRCFGILFCFMVG
jgi:hypothetical protein